MTERRIEETRLSQMQNERAKTELILVLLARAEKAKR
jgi:hypothetical protein